MHPDTDELLFALGGSVTIEAYEAGGSELVPLAAGSLVVIPRGRWHTVTSTRTTWWSCTTPPARPSRATIRRRHRKGQPAMMADDHRSGDVGPASAAAGVW